MELIYLSKANSQKHNKRLRYRFTDSGSEVSRRRLLRVSQVFSGRKCLVIWGYASLDPLPSAPFIHFLCFLSGKEAEEVFTFLRSVADLYARGQKASEAAET